MEFYYDPKRGILNIDKLKKRYPKESLDFVKDIETEQIYTARKVKKYLPIFDVKGHFQIDLMFYNEKVIFVAIDILTRKAFAMKIKNKTSGEIIKALDSFIDKNEVKKVSSDSDTAIIGNRIRKYLKEKGIEQNIFIAKESHHKLGIIDRFVRTLKKLINKYRDATGDKAYLQKIPDLVDNYNDSYHKGIKMTPLEMENDEEAQKKYIKEKVKESKNIRNKYRLNIGDKVRIRTKKKYLKRKEKILVRMFIK